MPKVFTRGCVALLATIWTGCPVLAAQSGSEAAEARAAAPLKRELIYGSELMTHDEREQYRVRMRGAKTAHEEAQVRREHYGDMQKRARQRGANLPDPPPAGSAK
jgi:hypothetical protein